MATVVWGGNTLWQLLVIFDASVGCCVWQTGVLSLTAHALTRSEGGERACKGRWRVAVRMGAHLARGSLSCVWAGRRKSKLLRRPGRACPAQVFPRGLDLT